MPQSLKQLIAGRIRRRRIELELTTKDVAQALGVSHQRITRIESGRHGIYVDSLASLAKVLLVHPGWFFGDRADEPLFLQTRQGAALARRQSRDCPCRVNFLRQNGEINGPMVLHLYDSTLFACHDTNDHVWRK